MTGSKLVAKFRFAYNIPECNYKKGTWICVCCNTGLSHEYRQNLKKDPPSPFCKNCKSFLYRVMVNTKLNYELLYSGGIENLKTIIHTEKVISKIKETAESNYNINLRQIFRQRKRKKYDK